MHISAMRPRWGLLVALILWASFPRPGWGQGADPQETPDPVEAGSDEPASEEDPAAPHGEGDVQGEGDAQDPSEEEDGSVDEAGETPSPVDGAPVEGVQGPTPAELEALEAALAADLAQEPTREPTPAPTAVVGAPALELAMILDVAAAWFQAEEPLQSGAHDPNRTGFTFQQLELSAGASVDPYLRFDANIVFAQFGVEVEEAYATTTALPGALQVRAGQFLTRFGRLNPTHPHSWSFLDQPLAMGKFFGGEGSRGLGAEVSWLAPTPWFLELGASLGDAAGACCARSFWGAQDLGVDTPADLLTTLTAKQFFELGGDWSLMPGLSMQTGPNPTGQGNRTDIYGVDLYLRWRPAGDPDRTSLSLQAEALVRQRQVPGRLLRDWGYYAQLVWQFDPRWNLGVRQEQVSGVLDDPLDPVWTRRRDRTALQVTWTPSHFSRLRLQVARDAPGWEPSDAWAVMFGLETTVGAHPAHNY